MKFGGHETFVIRDGWIPKGLALLDKDPVLFASKDAAEELGVGSNMIKSIRHWLFVCGLAEKEVLSKDGKRKSRFEITELGNLILKNDPYFVHSFTWWIIHINLCSDTQVAYPFHWFYNYFPKRQFERSIAQVSLVKHLKNLSSRVPAVKTLSNDVNILLSCYATVVPSENLDPEDGNDCALRRLNLLKFFKESGQYKLNTAFKRIPAEAFAYALCKLATDVEDNISRIAFEDISLKPGSPGRLFCLDAEGMYELALQAERYLGKEELAVTGMAGARQVVFRNDGLLYWVKLYFENQDKIFASSETEVRGAIC